MNEIKIRLIANESDMSVYKNFMKHFYSNHEYWQMVSIEKQTFKLKVKLKNGLEMYAQAQIGLDQDKNIMLINDINEATIFKVSVDKKNNKYNICSSDDNSVFMCEKDGFAKMVQTGDKIEIKSKLAELSDYKTTLEIYKYDLIKYQESLVECQKSLVECQKSLVEWQKKVDECQKSLVEWQKKVDECQKSVDECQKSVDECPEDDVELQKLVNECQKTDEIIKI